MICFYTPNAQFWLPHIPQAAHLLSFFPWKPASRTAETAQKALQSHASYHTFGMNPVIPFLENTVTICGVQINPALKSLKIKPKKTFLAFSAQGLYKWLLFSMTKGKKHLKAKKPPSFLYNHNI